jgi:hypothetical protein
MKLSFRIKHHFFGAFRELFVHHHGSLEFRAKIFALLIAACPSSKVDNYVTVKKLAEDIYKGDINRANLLILSTKEIVQKVKDNNSLDLDTLVESIQKELKIVPRYAKKIDVESLKPFLDITYNQDVISYQENILEFLQTLKDDTLKIYNKET